MIREKEASSSDLVPLGSVDAGTKSVRRQRWSLGRRISQADSVLKRRRSVKNEGAVNATTSTAGSCASARWQMLGLLSAITTFGFALRVYRLNYQSLWTDELLTHLNSNDAFVTVLLNSQDINIPPLYYLVIHILISFVDDLSMLRVPSVIFGSLSILIFYAVLAARFGRLTGFTGALLLATSPFHIWYSQEARPYALLLLLSLVSVLCLERALRNPDNRRWKVAFVISTTATLYCHTVALALLGFLGAYVAITVPREKWREWVGVFGAVSVLIVPVVYRLLVVPPVGSANTFESAKPLASIAYTLWAFGTGYSLGPTVTELHMPDRTLFVWQHLYVILPVMLFFCSVLVFGAFQLFGRDREAFWFTTLWLCFPLGFALVGSMVTVHPFNVRYSILAFPPFVGLMAIGIVQMKQLWTRACVICLICAVSLVSLTNYFFNDRYHRDDNRSAARFLSRHAHPNDLVIASAAYTAPNLPYYYQGEPITIVGYPSHKSSPDEDFIHPDPPGALFIENGHSVDDDIRRIVGERQRVWLFLSRVFHSDPYGVIPQFMDSRYERHLSASWPGTQLILYDTSVADH